MRDTVTAIGRKERRWCPDMLPKSVPPKSVPPAMRVRSSGAGAVPSESTYRLGAVMIGGIAGEAASGGPGICGAAMIGGAAPSHKMDQSLGARRI